MLRPQLMGVAQYERQRREYAQQLLACLRGERRPAVCRQVAPARQADPSLRRKLQIAARLQQVIQQAGYRYAGVECTDPTQKTALVHLERAGDGSQVTLVVGQEVALFEAAQPAAKPVQEASVIPVCDLAVMNRLSPA